MQPRLFQQRLFELAAEYESLHTAAFQAHRASGLSSFTGRLSGTSDRSPVPEALEAQASDGGVDGEEAGLGCSPEGAPQSRGSTAQPAAVSVEVEQVSRWPGRGQAASRHSVRDQAMPRPSPSSRISSSLSVDDASTDVAVPPGRDARRLKSFQRGASRWDDDLAKTVTRLSRRLSASSLPAPERRSLVWVVQSRYFTASFAVLIMVSTLLIGIETQVRCSASDQGSDLEQMLWILSATNYVCTFLFTVEFVARLYVFRSDFFVYERVWNLCDLAILLLALAEAAMELIVVSKNRNLFDGSGTAKILRILRLSRLLRLVRTFRHLRPLRMLVHSITFAAKSVFWAIMLLVMIIYAFGVVLTQAVMEHTKDDTRLEDEDLVSYFGDLYRSMLSLWMAVSGGISWIELTRPLERIGNITWISLLLLYIAFVYFFILNVVTGVFCQNAIEGAQQDLDLTIDAQLKGKQQHVERLALLFQEMNADTDALGDGLTVDELHFQLSKPKVQSWFQSLDVDTKQTWKLFKMIDADNSGRVSLEEFVEGCLRLRGSATRVDVESLKWEIRRANHGVDKAAERLAGVAEDVQELRRAAGLLRE